MGTRRIRKVAVIGSGVMGSQIACHFANIGVEALLLDIVPRELSEKEKASGLGLDNKSVRNRIVNDALNAAIKMKPAPLYSKNFAKRITTGNIDDDLHLVADADWIIEVVIERLDIKQQVFANIEKHRKPGTIISSNTSGIPIHKMIDGRSEDFQRHFLGTHFFNPPRYLELLEIIPTPKTDSSLIEFLMDYGRKYLGKKTVLCKDTPAFIANRIGVFSIMSLFHAVKEMGLTVEEVDKLTGPVLGRPKSATFRTCDVVGLDTLVHVANGVRENCPKDEERSKFEIPSYINKMVEENWLGSKTGQGFYKKVKGKDGKSEILSLDLNTLEYTSQDQVRFSSIGKGREIEDLKERTKILINFQDKGGEFYRKTFYALFNYISNRIPEIAEELYKIDDGMKAGFGWQLAPFETWDAVGVKETFEAMKKAGHSPAPWVEEMLNNGINSFYQIKGGVKQFYDIASKGYKTIPGTEDLVVLENLREKNTVWKNKAATIVDLGDGIINLEFHSKMNTIGGDTIVAINKAIDLAEESYKGLVIYNNGQNFSAGANVGMIFMMAVEQEYDELYFAIQQFQKTMMRIRYSAIPVVVATHQMALGGGCEMSMHSDKVIAHAETYMGLVEFGVGVIPGGGGSKEFALRLSDSLRDGDIRTNAFRESFLTIGQAKVATSAFEAFELGYLREGIDEVVISRELQLTRAKAAAIALADKGYTQPIERKDIKVLGKEALGLVYVGANSMQSGNYISEHDQLISEKLGYVLAGGDLSEITEVSESYLLELERKAFVELCATRKTLERLQSMVTKGKILRN
ncbi:MAG: 3-hydroxyacyl-CoA dehydrogenase/enoyl-CoA hydratase family protein [Bacteroidetes bacterium]|nr:MAG: 3-hydroxyacyl-CoA dehydrogenase/enoyl-CoA hydratase family protein [Bacteroidota bacterium]MBL1144151.1 3-hydroxyacyl-CoA dehydrogenase/enoyl-CoA hydratase family protein [Bacteroidota bacterium]NOG56947.1 3-hydroxyacyl-CoA dehydrogenase/enoyl-CoA hydratase family protein [Bacteroidota bacterium]